MARGRDVFKCWFMGYARLNTRGNMVLTIDQLDRLLEHVFLAFTLVSRAPSIRGIC